MRKDKSAPIELCLVLGLVPEVWLELDRLVAKAKRPSKVAKAVRLGPNLGLLEGLIFFWFLLLVQPDLMLARGLAR